MLRNAATLASAVVLIAVVFVAAAIPRVGSARALSQAEGVATISIRTDPALGQIWADSDGRTLYTFAGDVLGQSSCLGQCATVWPPFLISGEPIAPANVSVALGTITRPDGVAQLAINGAPVYYYSGDSQPGESNGSGIAAAWSVIRVNPAPPSGGEQSVDAAPAPTPVAAPPATPTADATATPAPPAPTTPPAPPTRQPPTPRPTSPLPADLGPAYERDSGGGDGGGMGGY